MSQNVGLTGRVPLVPLGKVSRITLGKMLQPGSSSEADREALYLRAASVTEEGTVGLDGAQTMWFRPGELSQLSLRTGDVVVVEGGSVGRSALIREDLVEVGFQNSINRVRPHSGVDSRFINYALKATRTSGFFDVYCDSVSMRHLTAEKLGWLRIPFPYGPDQVAIADFLDRETAQIDSLVAAQRELVRLLAERRDVVIRVAVTRGSDPDAVMTESDEEWIGAVPDHWGIAQVRRLGNLRTGTTPVGEESTVFSDDPEDTPWVRPEDLGRRGVGGRGLTAEGLSQLRPVPAGSVLICGIGATVSKTGQCSREVATNQQVTAWVHNLDPTFAYFAMTAAKDGVLAATVGNTLPILNNMRLGGVKIPVPPRPEQEALGRSLERTIAQVDSIIDAASESIALMLERRAALISAAVTGRIDPHTGKEIKEAS